MKKNLKAILGLSFVTLLSSCSGTAITVENAKEKVEKIITFQSENLREIINKGYEVSMTVKETDNKNNVEATIKYYCDEENYIERIVAKAKVKSPLVSSTVNMDMYMGEMEIDGWKSFYYVENNTKTYSDTKWGMYYEAMREISSYSNMIETILISQTSLLRSIDWDDVDNFTFKSKGEGHLYIESQESIKEEHNDDKMEVKSKEIVEFEDNLLKSFTTTMSGTNTSDGITNKTAMDVKIDVKWGCSLSMPDIKNYERVE